MITICTARSRTSQLASALAAAVLLSGLCAAATAQQAVSAEQPPASGAALHGRVTDLQGQPLFGVAVFTSRMDAPDGTPLVIGRAQTGFDGSFNITGMTPGTFRLCVDPQGKQYLDPCEWSQVPLTVQLEEKGLLRDLDIQVEAAETVSIEVDDQSDALAKFANEGKLESAERVKPSGVLLLGLRTRTGNLARARFATADKQTKKLRYTVAAPKNEDLDVVLMPVNLGLRDREDKALSDRGTVIRVTTEQRAQKPQEAPVISVNLERKGQ